jgi:thioredoxin 1
MPPKNQTWDEQPDHPITLKTENFHDAVAHYPLLVVDCWAGWCAPCHMIAPVIEELAKDYKGKMVFGKVDADADPAVLQEFGIMSIPTLLVFKNGKKVDQLIGAMPKAMLESRLTPHLT